MFTDGRYIAQAKQETSAARVVIAAKSARDEACQWLASSGVKHCAFDPETTTVADLALYRKACYRTVGDFSSPWPSPWSAIFALLRTRTNSG